MTYKQYYAYVEEFKSSVYTSSEQLLGDIGYPPDEPFTADSLITACDIICAVASKNIKMLIDISCMNIKAFGRKYDIPYHSIYEWVTGNRTPPPYISLLIGWEMITELPTEIIE